MTRIGSAMKHFSRNMDCTSISLLRILYQPAVVVIALRQPQRVPGVVEFSVRWW